MINIVSSYRHYHNVLYTMHSQISLGKTVKVAYWRLTDFLYFLTHLGNNAVIGKKSLFSILHRQRDHNSEQIAVNAMIQKYAILTKAHHDFFFKKVNAQYYILKFIHLSLSNFIKTNIKYQNHIFCLAKLEFIAFGSFNLLILLILFPF